MYAPHPLFESIDDDAKIWRFMDLARFLEILERESLFFVNPDKFSDPWDGCLPKKYFDTAYHAQFGPTEETQRREVDAAKEISKNRKDFAVSCWHINPIESEALWRNYSHRGIAIQSTFGRLKQSLDPEANYSVHVGKIDYSKDDPDEYVEVNPFAPILWKRKSFEYENELRAVIWQLEGSPGRTFDQVAGQHVAINLDCLIENIYTTPFGEAEWFAELVKDLIVRFGRGFKCLRSDLMDRPFDD